MQQGFGPLCISLLGSSGAQKSRAILRHQTFAGARDVAMVRENAQWLWLACQRQMQQHKKNGGSGRTKTTSFGCTGIPSALVPGGNWV